MISLVELSVPGSRVLAGPFISASPAPGSKVKTHEATLRHAVQSVLAERKASEL